jgi:outer membrane protein TolC
MEQQESSSTLAQQKYEAGLIPEVEALQMEVDLAQSRNDVLSAQGRMARVADSYRIAIGIPMDQAVSVTASLAARFYAVDKEAALHHALHHRAEIKDAEADLRRAEITVTETDAEWQVRGDIVAYYDLVGISDPALGTDGNSWGDRIDSAWYDLGRRPGNRGVSFLLSVPIWDSGVNKAEVASARAALHRRDLDRTENRRLVTQSVNAALTRMDEAHGRLTALDRSRELARRSYDISQERFANGDITSTELALDRDRWTVAELSWLDAYIQYELAGADLKRQTLYDFEHDRSLANQPETQGS